MVNYRSHGFSDTDKISIDNEVLIAYIDDYTVYRTIVYNHNTGNKAKDETIHLSDTTGTKLFSYYYFNNKSREGLVFNARQEWKKFDRELFVKSNGLDFANYDFFKLELGNPSAIEFDITKSRRIEKYANKIKAVNEPDSLYRYYDKDLQDIDFSFNESFDQKAKSKLYKVGLIYHASKQLKENTTKRRREDYFMISLVEDNVEKKKILRLYEEFRQKEKDLSSPNN